MGQKVNPIGMRLQVNRTWDSRWLAESKDYGNLLLEDLRMRAFVPHSRDVGGTVSGFTGRTVPVKTSPCIFGASEVLATTRYDRSRLSADTKIAGPAIVEDAYSTIVVPPGATLTADGHGHLHIEVGAAQ